MTTFMTVYTCKNDVVSLKHHFLLLFSCNFFLQLDIIGPNYGIFFFFFFRPTDPFFRPRNP